MYIPTRYPNAWSEGSPYQFYTRKEAEEAIEIGNKIIEYIEGGWRTLKSSRGG